MTFKPCTLRIGGRETVLDRPWIMGILNVTPDSFYSGSRCADEDTIRRRVTQLADEGADIIDIGAYSSRPGAGDVSPEEELRRLEQGMRIASELAPAIPVSVDTFRAEVARCAIEQLGADIINDISGGTLDPEMAQVVARHDVPYVLMHMRGTPATMQQLTDYDNVIDDVIGDLRVKIDRFHQAGVNQIIADPGFGFAKTLGQSYRLMAHLERFHSLGVPLLVGVSRKSMVYRLLGCTPEDALNGTTVLHTVALTAGAHILRVHDVRAAVEARTIVNALNESLT